MKAFGLCLPYSGSTEFFLFRFFLRFFGILAKMRAWAQSKSVLSDVLGRKLHSTFLQLQKLERGLTEADKYSQLQARVFFNNF